MKPSDFLTELSNDKLTQYKTAAAADASKADKEGDFKKGDKRFSGIVKATKKQFDNDAKKDVAEGSSMFAWNAGTSEEDFIRQFGKPEFDRLTKKYGISSIPVPDLYGYIAKEPTDPVVRRHRGLDGPGAKLKSIIKKQGVAEADIIGFRRSADAISKQKVWQSSAASDSKQDDKTFSYQGYTINFTPDKLNIYLGGDLVLSRKGNFANPTKMQLVAARGNIGKIIDDKRRAALIRSVIQKNKGIQGVAEEKCPHCNGPMVSEELMNEKKDACYYKVKSRYKVWPSAYASGALVKCRKKGASNWGNGGKKNESSILEGIEQADESLHDWFNKEKWVRMDTKGNIKGPCAKEPGEGKPKCLPQAKAHSLGKKGRASAAARKRREDPNPDRSGKAINVNTKKTKG
jgi:hypothetical protein